MTAQNPRRIPDRFIPEEIQGICIPQKVQNRRKFFIGMPEPEPQRQVWEELQVEAQISAGGRGSAEAFTGAAEGGRIGIDGLLQGAGRDCQPSVDMTAQGGHGDEGARGGAMGFCIAEVVENGQDLPVGIRRDPVAVFLAEDVAVNTADPVGKSAESQMEEVFVFFHRHDGLVIGQKPKTGGFCLKGVVVMFGDHRGLRKKGVP